MSRASVSRILDNVAQMFNLPRELFHAFAKIESNYRPNAQTGRYKGVFQLSSSEYKRYGGERGKIFDPKSNAVAFARKTQAESATFAQSYGRAPTMADLYMRHQQGIGGSAAHMANPQELAWKNMYSTAEGRQKGPGWSKKAIWGNLTPEAKKQFGNVNNVTSADFMQFWGNRVEQLGGKQPDASRPRMRAPDVDTKRYAEAVTPSWHADKKLIQDRLPENAPDKTTFGKDIGQHSYRTLAQEIKPDGGAVEPPSAGGGILQKGFPPQAAPGATPPMPGRREMPMPGRNEMPMPEHRPEMEGLKPGFSGSYGASAMEQPGAPTNMSGSPAPTETFFTQDKLNQVFGQPFGDLFKGPSGTTLTLRRHLRQCKRTSCFQCSAEAVGASLAGLAAFNTL